MSKSWQDFPWKETQDRLEEITDRSAEVRVVRFPDAICAEALYRTSPHEGLMLRLWLRSDYDPDGLTVDEAVDKIIAKAEGSMREG